MTKEEQTPSNLKLHQIILKILNKIPTYQESPITLIEIASSLSIDPVIPKATIIGITASTLTFLDMFGVLNWQGNKCKIKSELANYFLLYFPLTDRAD